MNKTFITHLFIVLPTFLLLMLLYSQETLHSLTLSTYNSNVFDNFTKIDSMKAPVNVTG